MRRHSKALDVAGFLVIGCLALLLWPQRWGGTMTYDITHGTSMQPTFVSGDLAVLRTASTYRVGDVAAYKSPSLKTTVMHRIKTASNGRYTFQGDNNDFVDPDTVTDGEMLGKLVVRVPKVGIGLRWLLRPINLVLAVGALFLLLSDRRERTAPTPAPAVPGAAPPVVVRITALRLPQELPTADVASQEELERLAAAYGVALLRGEDTDYVLHSGIVFRYDRASLEQEPRPLTRRPSPTGRDWAYGGADVVDLDSRRAVS